MFASPLFICCTANPPEGRSHPKPQHTDFSKFLCQASPYLLLTFIHIKSLVKPFPNRIQIFHEPL